jgi:hypothetical protein
MTPTTKTAAKKTKRVAPFPPTKWVRHVTQTAVPRYKEFEWVKVQRFEVELVRRISTAGLVVGADPGFAGLGLAYGYGDTVMAYQIDFNKEDVPDLPNQVTYIRGLAQFLTLQEGLNMAHLGLGVDTNSDGQTRLRCDRAVIEGAAMHNPQQEKLAYGRAGLIIGLSDAGLRVQIAAPASLNKEVFGSAYHKAKEIWADLLPKDAADAVALAILAANKEWKR